MAKSNSVRPRICATPTNIRKKIASAAIRLAASSTNERYRSARRNTVSGTASVDTLTPLAPNASDPADTPHHELPPPAARRLRRQLAVSLGVGQPRWQWRL